MDNLELRLQVIETGKSMIDRGLTLGTGGNVSARCPGERKFLITPSGMPYHTLTPEDIVKVDLDTWETEGQRKPSIEYHLHGKTYNAREDALAVVHVHSFNAMALAVARKPLPVITDVCALSMRGQVEVAEYGMSGSPELADSVVKALGSRNAVLMSNHGSLCVGKNLTQALDRCEVLEKLCMTFIYATILGGATSLPQETIVCLQEGLGKTYGQRK